MFHLAFHILLTDFFKLLLCFYLLNLPSSSPIAFLNYLFPIADFKFLLSQNKPDAEKVISLNCQMEFSFLFFLFLHFTWLSMSRVNEERRRTVTFFRYCQLEVCIARELSCSSSVSQREGVIVYWNQFNHSSSFAVLSNCCCLFGYCFNNSVCYFVSCCSPLPPCFKEGGEVSEM